MSQQQRFFIVRDFERLQYRADKSLPWIKLHVAMLDDPAFERLPDAVKFHYIGLLLLARKSERFDHALPLDAEYIARKLSLSEPLDLDLLLKEGFISIVKRQRKSKNLQEEADAQSADTLRPSGRSPDALDRDRDGEEKENGHRIRQGVVIGGGPGGGKHQAAI